MKIWKNEQTNTIIKAWVDGVPVEDGAIEQLKNVSSLPFVYKWVCAMPDVHQGVGATIGSVVATQGAVCPSITGVDIGCGMNALKTSLGGCIIRKHALSIREAIEKRIPAGRTNNGKKGDRGAWGDIPDDIQQAWDEYLAIEYNNIIAKYPDASHMNTVNHLGTLGGGNHFIEVCVDADDIGWIMIHSGSRGCGNKLGTYFINKAKEECKKWFIQLPDIDLAYFPQGVEYFEDYINAAKWAQKFAHINRQLIMQSVIEAVEDTVRINCIVDDDMPEINCHHNYLAWENHFGQNVIVTRKGAIRAREDDWGIIPGSMGAKSYIVKGKGNQDSFQSCSHGAGRAMSRSEAKKKITVEDHIKATEGVECRKDKSVLDESPAAYKDIDVVMEAQKDLVDVQYVLKQIVCVKGYED